MVETCSKTAADCPCLGFSVHGANGAGLSARCALSFSSVNMTPERGFAARWLRLFPFPLKIHFKGRQLPAERRFLKIFFASVMRESEFWQPAGQKFFSFHSLQHRVLKFAKRGGQLFSGFTYLLRVICDFAKWTTKKSSKSFSDLLLSLAAPVGGWYSVFQLIGQSEI